MGTADGHNGNMVNAIGVDVEEYFHAENIRECLGRQIWYSAQSRVEKSVRQVLDLFSRANVQGTFFVLGHVAKRHRALIQEISTAGHEVASHGYFHRLAYRQSPVSFRRDVRTAKHLLEDLIGKEVVGYRAPSFSICDSSSWAYDELITCGYQYDSSVYPIRHPRYANIDKPISPYLVERDGGSIVELPLAVWDLSILGKEYHLPAAGGAYWRLFPGWYTRWALRSIAARQRPAVCYFHPWEIDPGQPYFKELSWTSRLRHYSRLGTFERRLEHILKQFSFGPLKTIAADFRSKASAPEGRENA